MSCKTQGGDRNIYEAIQKFNEQVVRPVWRPVTKEQPTQAANQKELTKAI